MSNYPTKAELERVRAELAKLREQKPPTMRPTPTGAMRSDKNNVDQMVRKEAIEARQTRVKEITESFAKARSIIEKERDKFR